MLLGRVSAYSKTEIPSHPLCTTEEFSVLIRREISVVRRYIRIGRIAAHGRPALIHVSETRHFGLTLEDARLLLLELRSSAKAGNTPSRLSA